MNVTSEILFALAPPFKALADICNNRFNVSIFKKLNPKFWAKDTSAYYAKRIFGFRFDAWHLSMSAVICLLIGSIVTHQSKMEWYFEFIIYGVYWNLMFDLFYDKIFS